jgi:hypothetical protein
MHRVASRKRPSVRGAEDGSEGDVGEDVSTLPISPWLRSGGDSVWVRSAPAGSS